MGKNIFRSRKTDKPIISGPLLTADFVSAMTNLATAETAKYAADQTESQTMRAINSAGAPSNSVYVTPRDLNPNMQAAVARSSVDAHIKKAQAAQINSFTEQQIAQMETDAKQNYAGQKVKITVIDREFKPVESYWWNSRTGDYDKGTIKFKSLKGNIDDLSFRKNVLVIKPTLKSRLIIPQRKFLFVYVVNPKTLKPAVELELY